MIRHICRGARFALVGAVVSLAACGGGGGGSSSPDLSTAPGITVSPTSLSFAAVQSGALPPTQGVQITISAPNAALVGLAVPAANPPTWLDLSQPRLTRNSWTAAVLSTSLAPGTYTTTVSIGIADINQNILAFRNVQVSYTIQPQVGLAASPQSVSFSQLKGGPTPATQPVGLSDLGGGSYAWNASVTYQSGSGWLNINGASSASGASLPTSLSLSVNPSTALGTLSAMMHITGNGHTLDVPVSYTVSEPQVSPSPASLTFNALRLGASPSTQDVTLTTQGGIPVAFTAVVSYGAGATGWLNAPTSGGAPGPVTVGVNTVTLAPGTYTANLAINTATQNLSVSVTYVLSEPTLTRSPATLTFNAASGGTPPASQDVTLSTQQNLSLSYSASITYGTGPTGWLSVPTNGTAPGPISISANTANLVPGTYTATVVLTTAAQAVSIGITYVVATSSLTLGPTSASFTIDATSLASALSQNISVGSTGLALNWTAASSQPWVTVSPASGVSGSQVTVSLDTVQLDALDAGSRSATITFSYTPPNASSTSAPLGVTLNLQLAKVNYVSPYVQRPSTSTKVILRGSGFSNTAGLNVMFGANPVSLFAVVSDTEIRVTHPSLAAGTYQIKFPNQLGLTRSRASLLVAAPPTLSALAIPLSSPVAPDRIVYDAERVAVYTNNNFVLPGTPPPPPIPVFRIERNRFTNPGWTTDSVVLNGAPLDIAMTPDGLELIAISASTLYHIDLATWSISSQIDISSAFSFPLNTATFSHLSMSNDGNTLVFLATNPVRPFLYNVLTHTFTAVANFTDIVSSVIAARSSLDGSRILFGMGSSPTLYYYDASLAQIVLAVPGLVINRLAYDRTGTVSIADGTGYNRQFQVLGHGGINLSHPAVSPDGTRGYGVVPGENPAILRRYDLTSTDGGGQFIEILPQITLPDLPGDSLVVGISDDGATVFVVGEKNFIVQPLP